MTDQDPTRDRPKPGFASTAPHTGQYTGPHTHTDPLPDGAAATTTAPMTGGEAEMTTHDAPTHPLEPVAPEVAASLTDALRAMYDNVVDEPLPDAFAQLLSRLDDSDG